MKLASPLLDLCVGQFHSARNGAFMDYASAADYDIHETGLATS